MGGSASAIFDVEEIQALKLQGAIETLNYIAQEGKDESPGEETVAE